VITDRPPRLTVGMPIRNGAASLEAAVRSVLGQTFRDLEVVISDNASTDATPEICARLAAEDARIRYIRQPALLSIVDNFQLVRDAARAPYFMWAAHDDTRDADTAERLIAALDGTPDAILAFGDVVQVKDGKAELLPFTFATAGMSASQRLRAGAWRQLFHVYGVWRTEALRRISWREVAWWPDTPLMMAASQLGDFVHVPGPRFTYRFNPRPFFGWRARQDAPSVRDDVMALSRKAGALLRLIWLSYGTVAEVAGPLRGIEAMVYVALKVLGQITGFIWRRLPLPRGGNRS
jgi:glycosyltransferase involved in cell wall biosynthesis